MARYMDGQIFINYRRDDTQATAGRIYDRLVSHFASNNLFMDVDNLDPGVDFVEAIERSVGSSDVLIAIIGKNWLNSSSDEGRRRLDNPEDFVRMEITTALKRGLQVIPVLVDGALMPRSRDIPDDLKPLVRRNALEVRHTRFTDDCRQLIAALERVLQLRKEQREKERLEAEKRRNVHLEAEKREKEPLETEQREKERLEAEKRRNVHLEAEQRETEPLEPAQQRKECLEAALRITGAVAVSCASIWFWHLWQ